MFRNVLNFIILCFSLYLGSICLSICLSDCMLNYLNTIKYRKEIRLEFYRSLWFSLYLGSVCLSIGLFIYLSVCLSIYLFVYSFIYLIIQAVYSNIISTIICVFPIWRQETNLPCNTW